MSANVPFVGALLGAAIITTAATAGPEWIETTDAGSLYPTAQRTLGNGQLQGISGSLTGNSLMGAGDFEDMYVVRITNPALFSMAVMTADFDPQIFVFNVTQPGEAFGLLANDNTSNGNLPMLVGMSNDGSGAQVNLPGVYAIAISGAGRNPISINGNIFNYANPIEISGPDGQGGLNPHSGWSGEGVSGSYSILLTGVEFYDVPAPGALALVGLAGVLARGRRQRSA